MKGTSLLAEINQDTVLGAVRPLAPALKINNTDILSISVSSLNKEEDFIFNAGENFRDFKGSIFKIATDGTFQYHKLGKINAVGFTTADIKAKLENELTAYLKDPIVTVNFANHIVTIMGEVVSPKQINMETEQYNVFDALAASGMVTPNADFSKVMVIREKDGTKQAKMLNLEDHSIFNSEYYLLQPNDVVVVKTNDKKLLSEQKRLSYQQVSAITVQIVSLSLIVYQAFFRK